jgi:hypothetical protein
MWEHSPFFVIVGVHSWDQLQLDTAADPARQPGFGIPLAPGLCR